MPRMIFCISYRYVFKQDNWRGSGAWCRGDAGSDGDKCRSYLRSGTLGDILVLFATFAWAITAIITRKYLKELPAQVITFYRFLLAGIIFFVYL